MGVGDVQDRERLGRAHVYVLVREGEALEAPALGEHGGIVGECGQARGGHESAESESAAQEILAGEVAFHADDYTTTGGPVHAPECGFVKPCP